MDSKTKALYEEYQKLHCQPVKMSDGGDPGFEQFLQEHPNLDPGIAKTAYQYRISHAKNIPVQPKPADLNPMNLVPEKTQQIAQQFAEGGEVESENLTPEEFEKHVQSLKDQGLVAQDVQGDEQNINGLKGPEDLLNIEEDKNPEDEQLENEMANEDFQSGEQSDENDSKDEDDGESETAFASAPSKKEDILAKTAPVDQAAGLQVDPTLQKAMANQDPIPVQPTSAGEDLKTAQRQRDMNIASQGIMKGAALAASGFSKTNPKKALDLINDDDKYVNLPVQKYEEKIANQQNDPSSPMSNVIKEYLQNKGFKVPEGASAADLLKVVPFLTKDATLQMQMQKALMQNKTKIEEGEKNRKSREEIARENQRIAAARDAAYKERTEKSYGGANDRKMQTRFDTYAKALREGGDQSVKLGRQNIIRAKNLFLTNGISPDIQEKEIDHIPDAKLNSVNKIQVVENGIELNRLLSGSNQSAQSTLQKLIPNNAEMSTTQIEDYITNRLNPADQAQALKVYMKIAARVRDLNKGVVNNYNKQAVAGADQVFQYFPEQSKLLLEEMKNQGFDMTPTQSKEQSGAKSIHKPGDVVQVKGKNYRVGADGDSLEEII